MAIRPIIEINEDLCDGCGDCIVSCEENALEIVNGKAKLVREPNCDGFGVCIGHCPTGAITLVEREAPDFVDPNLPTPATPEPPKAPQGLPGALPAMPRPSGGGGCPGSMQRSFTPPAPAEAAPAEGASALAQWPVQLHLLRPDAPFFKNRELLLMADCGPVATPNVHAQLMKNRALAIACPKLDNTEGYVEKLAEILQEPTIPRLLVAVMEVPCCGGLYQIARAAAAKSGRSDLQVDAIVIKLDGTMVSVVE